MTNISEQDIKEFRQEALKNIIDPSKESFVDLKIIEVPLFKSPKVSIIIPAYNQMYYTYNTIDSVIKSFPRYSYEIIVMDDNSSQDEARNLVNKVKNIKFICNDENLGFLRNCNKGSEYAEGEYILFLNNDTYVLNNWLDSLVELIESKTDIGMVGSKLVYPDGRLQEAGGIIWDDASGWNYGRLDTPTKPEYNYVKEVDYISGASIMIKKSLWDKIGGFDQRYAPAYYEDADLAFEVRNHGELVVYQPKSVLVHFEGISCGTDTDSGIKKYQVVNHEKFYEKWKNVLNKESFPNGKEVYWARDRSKNKKTLLFIDHYLPHFDQDAGSRATFHYLELFVKQGLNVKFIGDNFYNYPGTPYLMALEEIGIEVLHGNYYKDNWEKWLDENGDKIEYVILSRPHIAEIYITQVKKYTEAKIIYFPVDLHYLREEREYQVKQDDEILKSSKVWKELEYKIINESDLTCVYSHIEVEEIAKEAPAKKAIQIPLFIYDDFPAVTYTHNDRKDIMFIGGFNHTPNVDAIVWFVEEIMPIIRQSDVNIKLNIAGSEIPEKIYNYANTYDDIVVLGRVSDEQLKKMYGSSRLSIAPLRFGAGMKGKVVECLHNGIPLVTTSIGAEGLESVEDIIMITDNAIDFANHVVDLYINEEKCIEISEKSQRYCKKYFSSESAIESIFKRGIEILDYK